MSSRSRLLLAFVASALLIPTAPVMAKGIASASVCGTDGCTMVAHATTGSASCPQCSAEELLSIHQTAHPATRAPYVRIVLTLGAGGEAVGTQRLLYAPTLQLAARRSDVTGDWTWYTPPAAAIEIVTRMIGDIRPYPAAGMPLGVTTPTAAAGPRDQGPADSGGSPLLAGGAVLAIALFAAGALAARRRRSGRRALGST